MSAFVEFERQVLRLLLSSHMSFDQIENLIVTAAFVSCEHTGVGYFLTVRHPAVPMTRVVCSQPMIEGRAKDIECGFVVFLEGGALMLECHSWRDAALPTNLRQRQIEIRVADG